MNCKVRRGTRSVRELATTFIKACRVNVIVWLSRGAGLFLCHKLVY